LSQGVGAQELLDPGIRFQHPWTPMHELPAEPTFREQGTINLAGDWRFWADVSETQAGDIISGKRHDLVESIVAVPASTIGWGFDAENSGLFMRTFHIPDPGSERRVMLKCEGIFERARIFLNGHQVADHIGWTPFETDITDWIRHEKANTLAVFVTMEGYAPESRLRIRKVGYPDLGGILRPILIHIVPQAHVMDLYIIPHLAPNRNKWSLEAQVTFTNPTAQSVELTVAGSLRSASGKQQRLEWLRDKVTLPAGARVTRTYSGPVKGVQPWSAESPHLYHLVVAFNSGQSEWQVAERFGFRTVEIRGESVLLNGQPVMLRGIAYKGGHADYGNAAPYAVLNEEVELMKRANINTVRLGWAFKSPDLHRVCDEKGMYVISTVGPDQFQFPEALAIQQYCEAFMCLKNSPTILFWELQNENPRTPTPAYLKIMELSREIDPHRQFCHPGAYYEGLDLICPHYLPQLFADERRDGRPFLPTEYAHTASYELEKLKYDPGIHDLWGYSLKRGWDIIQVHPWVAGCITFAWRDPYVRDRAGRIVPALHHESRWGIVDESFRIKPEYHHLWKVYAPVRIYSDPIPADNRKKAVLTVKNGYDFTNLGQRDATWKIIGPEGVVREGRWKLEMAPHTQKEVKVPAFPPRKGNYLLELTFKDAEGRLIQRDLIPFIWKDYPQTSIEKPTKGKLSVIEEGGLVKVTWSQGDYYFNKTSGLLCRARVGHETLAMAGPHLNERLSLPRAGRWFDWRDGVSMATENWTRRVFPLKLESFQVTSSPDSSQVKVETAHQYLDGSLQANWTVHYDGQITLTLTLPPNGNGVSWRFPVNCRNVTEEMTRSNLSRRFPERLSWRKNGLWTWYPDDHIGRNTGIASFLNPHDPQNRSMKINTAFLAVGPRDKSMNMVIRDPGARIHVKCHPWYNEFEVFIQGRLEDDYDYFDRTNPLRALPHALADDQRTYTFSLEFMDKEELEQCELEELDPYMTLIKRSHFWSGFTDDLSVEDQRGTVRGLPLTYPE
ncbi:MAG: hypothetical protein JSU61_13865, partial [Fidelibacterota bacterium]